MDKDYLSRYNITLINGDGIGPDLASSAKTILESINDNSKTKFTIDEISAGDNAISKFGKALPDLAVAKIKKSDACLKGPVGESAADVIIVLRQMFDLYANVRPSKSFPNIPTYYNDIDLVIIRENTEDLYLGWEFYADEKTVVALRLTSERACRRIAEYAFKMCTLRNKKCKVVAVHKANVLRKGDGLFARTCKSVAEKYPNIEYSELYVDACAMNLIRNPGEFDVILTTNLFGDILSDEASQVAGSLGMGSAANIGDDFGLFEPVHGAAFDIAGKNIANPSSILLSTKMMLEWLAYKNNDKDALKQGNRIEDVILGLLKKNKKTKDIGGELTTKEFTNLVKANLY
ncbi:MAG: isocitrate/isopropylmalate dehydrogenase family protein [Thermoproteota archaeon]|jgi:3-isopropylmalate dehydrogenase|nr:isocitrate/isopropylmalate dehydrogenase family protein [Thermoproteota archaeon]